MNKTIVQFLVKLGLLASLAACQNLDSTTTGNPFVTLTIASSSQTSIIAKSYWQKALEMLTPAAVALPPPTSLVDASGNPVTLSAGWITMGEIEFEATESADENEVDGDQIVFAGPYSVDLFASFPFNIGTAQIGQSQVRRIKMKLMRTEIAAVGVPTGLQGNSLYLTGTVNGHNFSFTSRDDVKFEVGGPNSLTLGNGTTLLLSLKLVEVIKLIDLSSISSDVVISEDMLQSATTPCPSVDAGANDLYTCFREAIEKQANLGKDDGNGEIDSDEDSVK